MKILIATGIYPPKIGGPAQYSKNLKEIFEKNGNNVSVVTFGIENYLPTGIRHIYFFIKVIPRVLSSNMVVIMDTFSVGFPTVLACKLLGKKSIIRTGGDFLWEEYVERTGKKILFRNFYKDEINNLTNKEKIIFKLTKWTLDNASRVIFSTDWQRDIFVSAYNLDIKSTLIIENYYGEKESDMDPDLRLHTFIASARDLKWKNLDMLKNIFNKNNSNIPSRIDLLTTAKLVDDPQEYPEFMKSIKNCYAVILVSLGDISPNMIMDAIRYNRPFICTKEVGIFDRIKDVGIFVDPLNEEEIESAIHRLLDKEEYEKAREKVRQFNFTHSWQEIGSEFLSIYNSIK